MTFSNTEKAKQDAIRAYFLASESIARGESRHQHLAQYKATTDALLQELKREELGAEVEFEILSLATLLQELDVPPSTARVPIRSVFRGMMHCLVVSLACVGLLSLIDYLGNQT